MAVGEGGDTDGPRWELFMVKDGVEDEDEAGETHLEDKRVEEGMEGRIFLEWTEELYCCWTL